MKEEITVELDLIKLMDGDALDFFTDEISRGNDVRVTNCEDGKDKIVSTMRDWDNLTKNREKKAYRI